MQDWRILVYLVLAGRILLVNASTERALPTILDDPVIGSEKGAIHVVISTECFKSYFVYQALAMKYTFDKVGQPGKITRVISCNEDEAKEKLKDEDLAIMDTLVVPNWKQHPITGDYYQPYNKPVSMMFWLAERLPTAEWTLILDPDMIFKQPFTLKDFEVPEGYALSSHYNYLAGVNNALADRHIPDVPRKEDHYGGPSGRRADEAGAFYFVRTRDLAKIAPLWLSYTEAVREDPNAWNLTGDTKIKQGQKAWISEMYGYVFAAAKVGIRHKVESAVQYYPGYPVKDIPVIVHYGLRNEVGNYVFSKHEHFDFESLRCPPWNMSANRKTAEDIGLLLHPPYPKSSITEREPRKKYSHLLAIDVVNTINKALCERHRRECTDQKEAVEEQCGIVDKIEKELDEMYAYLHIPGVICHDDHEFCLYWRQRKECDNTWMYMRDNCRASCEICRTYIPSLPSFSYAQSDSSVTSQSDAQRLEAMEKIRCLHLGIDKIMDDIRCRVFVARGDIKADNYHHSRLHLTGRPVEVSSFYLPTYITAVALTAFVLSVLVALFRSRRKRARKHLHV